MLIFISALLAAAMTGPVDYLERRRHPAIPQVGPWIARVPLFGIAALEGWQTFVPS